MAAGIPQTAPPGGYDYEFVEEVDRRLICLICESPLKDAVQTKCGHKFCRDCLNEWLSRSNNRCPTDRELLDPERHEIFPDVSTQREIMDLRVNCKGPRCDWVGELREAETHVEKCTNANCKERLPRPDMKKHVENECEWRVVSCGYCCTGIPKREEENHHKECKMFPLRCVNSCEQDPIPRSELQNHLDNVCPLTVIPCPYENIGCNEKFQRKCLDQHTVSGMARHLQLACDKLMSFEKAQVELNTKLQRHESQLQTMCTKLIWPIRGFKGLQEQNSEIYSPPFYSWNHGYKLKLEANPNGYGGGKGTHLSVFVRVMKGEYDAILSWPFNRRVEITLLSQQQDKKDHIVETVDFSKTDSECNGKPTTEKNAGWGKFLFISHKALRNSPYLVDDTIFLQAKVLE